MVCRDEFRIVRRRQEDVALTCSRSFEGALRDLERVLRNPLFQNVDVDDLFDRHIGIGDGDREKNLRETVVGDHPVFQVAHSLLLVGVVDLHDKNGDVLFDPALLSPDACEIGAHLRKVAVVGVDVFKRRPHRVEYELAVGGNAELETRRLQVVLFQVKCPRDVLVDKSPFFGQKPLFAHGKSS